MARRQVVGFGALPGDQSLGQQSRTVSAESAAAAPRFVCEPNFDHGRLAVATLLFVRLHHGRFWR
jgi:hypothetical protein